MDHLRTVSAERNRDAVHVSDMDTTGNIHSVSDRDVSCCAECDAIAVSTAAPDAAVTIIHGGRQVDN